MCGSPWRNWWQHIAESKREMGNGVIYTTKACRKVAWGYGLAGEIQIHVDTYRWVYKLWASLVACTLQDTYILIWQSTYYAHALIKVLDGPLEVKDFTHILTYASVKHLLKQDWPHHRNPVSQRFNVVFTASTFCTLAFGWGEKYLFPNHWPLNQILIFGQFPKTKILTLDQPNHHELWQGLIWLKNYREEIQINCYILQTMSLRKKSLCNYHLVSFGM